MHCAGPCAPRVASSVHQRIRPSAHPSARPPPAQARAPPAWPRTQGRPAARPSPPSPVRGWPDHAGLRSPGPALPRGPASRGRPARPSPGHPRHAAQAKRNKNSGRRDEDPSFFQALPEASRRFQKLPEAPRSFQKQLSSWSGVRPIGSSAPVHAHRRRSQRVPKPLRLKHENRGSARIYLDLENAPWVWFAETKQLESMLPYRRLAQDEGAAYSS